MNHTLDEQKTKQPAALNLKVESINLPAKKDSFQDMTFNDSENNFKRIVVNESTQQLNKSISEEHHVFRETTQRDKPVMAGKDNDYDNGTPSESYIAQDSQTSL